MNKFKNAPHQSLVYILITSLFKKSVFGEYFWARSMIFVGVDAFPLHAISHLGVSTVIVLVLSSRLFLTFFDAERVDCDFSRKLYSRLSFLTIVLIMPIARHLSYLQYLQYFVVCESILQVLRFISLQFSSQLHL